MPNALGNYNEIFFAQEALIQVQKALGMAGRVYRQYDPTPSARGDTIRIRKPGTFTAQNAPSSAQDLNTESVSITLDKWREVKFELTDKELSLSAPQLIEEHISPAAYALADDIDLSLAALFKLIPWYSTASSTFDIADIANVRKVLFNNQVPLEPGRLHLMVDGGMEANLLGFLAGKNVSGAGVDAARQRGAIGEIMGFGAFANQNTPSFTTTQLADNVGVAAAALVGATSIAVGGLTASQASSIKEGDIITIAGHTQQYVAAAAASTDGSGDATITISPALKVALAGSEVVTIVKLTGARSVNIGFHRNFAALAMAPLSELGNELGARIATIADPVTGLALRSRLYYEGGNSKVGVALDVLYGVKMLDQNLATRFYSA